MSILPDAFEVFSLRPTNIWRRGRKQESALVVDMECFDVTVPRKPCAPMQILANDLIDKADFYRGKFDSANPFRHVLITPFFDSAIAETMLQKFPVPLESQMQG